MKNSKIIQLLSTFSNKELKQFSLFVNAPYFNKSTEVSRLLEYLCTQYPQFLGKNIQKELIFKHLYPERTYEDKQMRYLMSNLLKLGEQFLLSEKIKTDSIENDFALLDEFNNRRLGKHYAQVRRKAAAKINKQPSANANLFWTKTKLSDLDEHHFALQHKRKFDNNIQVGSDALNRYFALKKLKYACAMLDRQALLRGSYQLNLPNNWTQWIISNNYFGEKIIEIYTSIFLALKNEENSEYFSTLKDLLLSKPENIDDDDLKNLFLFAINYCARKIRKGENRFRKEALDIYLAGIEQRILLNNNQLSPWTLGNIVKLSLRLKTQDWIEQFIEKNIILLPPDFRENALYYNLSELYFYKKNFTKALELLTKVEFSDLVYQLGSRTMLAKIYTELDEKNALFSLLISFKMFLKRNKNISDNIRMTYLNFCNILSAIVRGKTKDISEKIEQTTLLTDREWLLGRVSGLS